jgi:hypothetical protein
MEQKKLISLDNVTSSIPFPWNTFIEKILSRPLPWGSLPRRPNEGELALIWHRVFAWEVALHWVIKKEWNTKYRIPTKRSLAEAYEPKGEFLRQMLLLCERCHAMQEEVPINIPYPHAGFWFGLVFWNLIIREMVSAMTPEEQPKSVRNKRVALPKQNPTHRKKRIQIQAEMDEVMQLQTNYQNPLQENDERKTALFYLFEAASTLAQKSNIFHNHYWRPFLNAWKDQVKAKAKPEMGLVVKENDKCYVQLGRGRGKRILYSPESFRKLFFETFT